jgi:hypothetical protein
LGTQIPDTARREKKEKISGEYEGNGGKTTEESKRNMRRARQEETTQALGQ